MNKLDNTETVAVSLAKSGIGKAHRAVAQRHENGDLEYLFCVCGCPNTSNGHTGRYARIVGDESKINCRR